MNKNAANTGSRPIKMPACNLTKLKVKMKAYLLAPPVRRTRKHPGPVIVPLPGPGIHNIWRRKIQALFSAPYKYDCRCEQYGIYFRTLGKRGQGVYIKDPPVNMNSSDLLNEN